MKLKINFLKSFELSYGQFYQFLTVFWRPLNPHFNMFSVTKWIIYLQFGSIVHIKVVPSKNISI